MLLLTRREDESITLKTHQGEIKILVADISGSQVWIAIDAPDDVEILRTELLGGGD